MKASVQIVTLVLYILESFTFAAPPFGTHIECTGALVTNESISIASDCEQYCLGMSTGHIHMTGIPPPSLTNFCCHFDSVESQCEVRMGLGTQPSNDERFSGFTFEASVNCTPNSDPSTVVVPLTTVPVQFAGYSPSAGWEPTQDQVFFQTQCLSPVCEVRYSDCSSVDPYADLRYDQASNQLQIDRNLTQVSATYYIGLSCLYCTFQNYWMGVQIIQYEIGCAYNANQYLATFPPSSITLEKQGYGNVNLTLDFGGQITDLDSSGICQFQDLYAMNHSIIDADLAEAPFFQNEIAVFSPTYNLYGLSFNETVGMYSFYLWIVAVDGSASMLSRTSLYISCGKQTMGHINFDVNQTSFVTINGTNWHSFRYPKPFSKFPDCQMYMYPSWIQVSATNGNYTDAFMMPLIFETDANGQDWVIIHQGLLNDGTNQTFYITHLLEGQNSQTGSTFSMYYYGPFNMLQFPCNPSYAFITAPVIQPDIVLTTGQQTANYEVPLFNTTVSNCPLTYTVGSPGISHDHFMGGILIDATTYPGKMRVQLTNYTDPFPPTQAYVYATDGSSEAMSAVFNVSMVYPTCDNLTQIINTTTGECSTCRYSKPDSTQFNCVNVCAPTQIVQPDGSCLCSVYTYFDPLTNNCTQDQCASNQIIVQNGTCQTCPDYQRSDSQGFNCTQVTCESFQILEVNGSCRACEYMTEPDEAGLLCIPTENQEEQANLLNQAPIFNAELQIDEVIFIDNAEVIIDLPEIIDDQSSNFRSIQISSNSLGSVLSSNETGDFTPVSDQYISYEFSNNKIQINLPPEQLTDFEGLHAVQIILTDDLDKSRTYSFDLNFVCTTCISNSQNETQENNEPIQQQESSQQDVSDQDKSSEQSDQSTEQQASQKVQDQDLRQYISPFFVNKKYDFIEGARYQKVTIKNDKRRLEELSYVEAMNKAVQMGKERGAFGFFYQQMPSGNQIFGFYMTEDDMQGQWVYNGLERGALGSLKDIRDQSSFEESTFTFPVAKVKTDQVDEQIIKKKVRPPISIDSTEFTQGGLVTLDFSEELYPIDTFFNANTSLDLINKDIKRLISIEYFSQVDFDPEDEETGTDVKIPKLKIYSIHSFSERHIDIQLNFTDPLYVSSEPVKDHIQVKFLTHQLFMAKADNLTLVENYEIKKISVPAQIASQEDLETVNSIATSAQNGLLASFLIPFLFMLFARVSMNRVWALYYMLQIMSNLANYLTLLIPSNALTLVQIIKNVACFRLLRDPTVQRYVQKYIFRGKAQWLKEILMDQGADVTNQIIFFLFLAMIMIGSRIEYVKTYCENEKKELMWSGWLRGKITCYFPTCILICTQINQIIGYESGLESTPMKQNPTWFDYFRSGFKISILLLLPIYSFIHLKTNKQKFSDSDFDQKYGTLYLNMNKTKYQALTYSSFFCLKRLVIGVATVYLNSSVISNAYINIFANLAFIKFLADSMPMEFSYLNQLELMNEVTMLFFNYFFFLFTDFVTSVETRYLIGKYFIYLTIFVICVNCTLISISMYNDMHYEHRVKKAEKAWKEYRRLKVKMAAYIIQERGHEVKGLLGKEYTLNRGRQVKRLVQKLSYKQMEGMVIDIIESKKPQKPNLQEAVNEMLQLNVLSIVRKNRGKSQSFDRIENTPRFGERNSIQEQQQSSLSKSSDSSFPSDFTIDQEFVRNEIDKITHEVRSKREQILEPEEDDDGEWDLYEQLHNDVVRDESIKMCALFEQQKMIRTLQRQKDSLNNCHQIDKNQIDRRFLTKRTYR